MIHPSLNNLSPRQRRLQGGYLLEIPILLFVVVMALLIIIPYLSVLGRKILVSIGAVPILFALFYMIVIPGWTPGDRGRVRWPWNWLVFLLFAIVIVFVVVMIDLA